jgi:hypothetical protein
LSFEAQARRKSFRKRESQSRFTFAISLENSFFSAKVALLHLPYDTFATQRVALIMLGARANEISERPIGYKFRNRLSLWPAVVIV